MTQCQWDAALVSTAPTLAGALPLAEGSTTVPIREQIAGRKKPRRKPPERKRVWRPRKLGLLFSAMKVEVEEVKKAHRVPCATCGKVPTGRRLVVVKGTARAQVKYVYCEDHGGNFLSALRLEVERAAHFLGQLSKVKCIRVDPRVYPGTADADARAAARKKARELDGHND